MDGSPCVQLRRLEYLFQVIRRKVRIVISIMLNDNQCFRVIGFMVSVIAIFATTCLTIIISVN